MYRYVEETYNRSWTYTRRRLEEHTEDTDLILLSIVLMIFGFLGAIIGTSTPAVFIGGVIGLLAGIILMVVTVRRKMR